MESALTPRPSFRFVPFFDFLAVVLCRHKCVVKHCRGSTISLDAQLHDVPAWRRLMFGPSAMFALCRCAMSSAPYRINSPHRQHITVRQTDGKEQHNT